MKSLMAGVHDHGRSVSAFLTVIAMLAIVTFGTPARIVAAEQEGHETAGEEHGTTGEHGEAHGEEHHHKNHAALFIGSTEAEEHHGEKGDRDFTLGFDYERRLSKHWGFGGMIDWVAEGNREYLVGPIGFLHPYKGAKLYAAPCYQAVRESGEDNFVFRVGASWDFEVGKFSIAPHLIYDFAEEQNFFVFGVGIGRGW